MTNPTTPPAPPLPAPPTPDKPNRFFDWVREAGIMRDRGWLGGVATGISYRVGIDPILVRGIFVVITVLGFPAILLYAILWAVLPDSSGRIQLQDLFRGRLHPQMLGISAAFALSLVPVTSLLLRIWQIVFFRGMYGWYDDGSIGWSGNVTFAMMLGTLVLALLVAVVVVGLGRMRTARSVAAPAQQNFVNNAPAGAAEGNATAEFVAVAGDEADNPPAEVAPAPDSDEFEQWRENQAKVQRERESFLAGQQSDEGALERAAQEQAAARRAFFNQMALNRAERRAANPRARFAYNAGIVGVAAVVACVVVLMRLWMGIPDAIALAAFTGAFVLAAGMLIAGALRRRSGFLAFATVAALIVGAEASVPVVRPAGLLWDGASLSSRDSGTYHQPFGYTTVWSFPDSSADESAEGITIVKGDGQTSIYLDAGANLDLDVSLGSGAVYINVLGDDGYLANEIGAQPVKRDGKNTYAIDIDTHLASQDSVTHKVTLDQISGWVDVTINPDWNEQDPKDRIAPDITINGKDAS